MLKQRIIGAITILDGWAVQSMGYKRYLPLGRPEVIAKNLDRWGADEILVQCINRSKENAGPDFKVLSQIANEGITTPLKYAGGIKNHQQAIKVIRNKPQSYDARGSVKEVSKNNNSFEIKEPGKKPKKRIYSETSYNNDHLGSGVTEMIFEDWAKDKGINISLYFHPPIATNNSSNIIIPTKPPTEILLIKPFLEDFLTISSLTFSIITTKRNRTATAPT